MYDHEEEDDRPLPKQEASTSKRKRSQGQARPWHKNPTKKKKTEAPEVCKPVSPTQFVTRNVAHKLGSLPPPPVRCHRRPLYKIALTAWLSCCDLIPPLPFCSYCTRLANFLSAPQFLRGSFLTTPRSQEDAA